MGVLGVVRRRRIVLGGMAIVALALTLVVPATARATAHAAAPADAVEQTLDAAAAGTTSVYAVVRNRGGLRMVRHLVRGRDADRIVAQLRNLPGVVAAGLDGFAYASEAGAASDPTNDPGYSQQWALQAADFQSVWPTSDGTGTTVAVLDTGIRGTHQDLAGRLDAGADCVSASSAANCSTAIGAGWTDYHGHGTHVAGIITGRSNNGVGITGAAPGARILPVRVLDSTGVGTWSAIAAGIIWATDHGADIISMSFGGDDGDAGVQQAITYARNHDVFLVAASGNNYFATGSTTVVDNEPQYPAKYAGVLSVGSIKNKTATLPYMRSGFSNTASNVGIVAPGSSVYSTTRGSDSTYGTMSGTSMATPYVAAAAALVRAAAPSVTADQIRAGLTQTATALADSGGYGSPTGFGLLEPKGAFALLAPGAVPTTTSTTTTSTSTPPTTDPNVTTTTADPTATTTPSSAVPSTTTTKATTTTIKTATTPTTKPPVTKPAAKGYWVAYRDGVVRSFGVPHYGDRAGRGGSAIVAMSATPTRKGYWLSAADGSVFAYGNAKAHGSFAGKHLNAPIVAMGATKSGKGYWLMGRDGGIFTFGDARFYGSTGDRRLSAPIVDLAPTPTGKGYWLVAADGGIFTFGDAKFYGSTGAKRLAAPVTSMAADPTGKGYWLIARDGGVFAFKRPFYGSLPGLGVRKSVARLRSTPSGAGYWMLTTDGGVYRFGDAPAKGSTIRSAALTTAVDISAG
jgi:subtilisin family serine protease